MIVEGSAPAPEPGPESTSTPQADTSPPSPNERRRADWAELNLVGLAHTRALTDTLRGASEAAGKPSFRELRDRSARAGSALLTVTTLQRMFTPNPFDASARSLPEWLYYEALMGLLGLDPAQHVSAWQCAQAEWRSRPRAGTSSSTASTREPGESAPHLPDGASDPPRADDAGSSGTAASVGPRRRRRRGLVVLAATALLGLAIAGFTVFLRSPSPGVGASVPGPRPSHCDVDFKRTTGPFYYTATYQGKGRLYCGYTDRGEWLQAVTDANIRGVDNKSGYAKLDIQDASTGMEVTAQYNSCPNPDKVSKCPAQPAVVHQAPGADWTKEADPSCQPSAPPAPQHLAESAALAAFLTDVGEVERGNLGRASLGSGHERVADARCG